MCYVQVRYPLMSNHKTLKCEVLYKKEYTPLHSTLNKPHHCAQTSGAFLSGLCLLPSSNRIINLFFHSPPRFF